MSHTIRPFVLISVFVNGHLYHTVQPGFVLKTASLPDNVKAFVNVCQSEAVEKATATRGTGERGQRGEQWSIPFSLSPSREDVDKGALVVSG